ncbi:L,D-transpeptidase family protein [Akkermansia muciniphila]|nr:L,D-transpeptidase family protein [Akkermansia muciniphila]
MSKKEDHTSNLYGKMYDAEGKCINYNAESTDPIPEGGRFDGSPMPYWQRLTNAGLGLHVGKVRRHPVSHGCVRLPRNVAEILYRQTSIGTPVTIQKTPLPVPEAQKIPPAQQQESEGRKQ